MTEGWNLSFSFPDQSPSFAHGWTCGQIWWRMSESYRPILITVDADCRETIVAMAMKMGWQEEIKDVADGWIEVHLTHPEFSAENEA